jgi:N-acetyltransferase 10
VVKASGDPFTPYDLKRLQAYSSNLVDHHMILDLIPSLANSFYAEKLPANLSYIQAAILLMLGLQQRNIDGIQEKLDLPANQVLALFNKAVRKLHAHIKQVKIAAMERTLPKPNVVEFHAHERDLDDDLDEAAEEVKQQMAEKLAADGLQKYAIGDSTDFKVGLALVQLLLLYVFLCVGVGV